MTHTPKLVDLPIAINGIDLPSHIGKDVPWEPIYHSIQSERLWPSEPTISNLDLESWKQAGITKILDAGCGDGKNLAWSIEQGCFGVGVDASASALDSCRDYLDRRGLKNKYLLLPARELESVALRDEEFPGIICIDVLGHSQHPRQIITELIRILQPGGQLYLSVFHPDDGCRLGPRMRSGKNSGEYWYTPSVPSESAPNLEYYYHFYTEPEVRDELLANLPIEILKLEYKEWLEPPHERYREEEHRHASWFVLLRRL
jgi:SAM-dependent methyltransferase